jgi:hypothetical protein
MTYLAFANRTCYSDVEPFEVVKRVSERTLEIRAMNYERANPDDDLGFAPGGFFGHCARQDRQEWTITANPDAPVFRIRLQKNGQWRDEGGDRYQLAEKPRRFYDYNFLSNRVGFGSPQHQQDAG